MTMTIKEAREILQDNTMSDAEVEAAISGLQLLVEVVFDHWSEEKKLKAVKDYKKK